jgi:hypothetical protein
VAITDTGGFDLSLELTEELLNAAFTAPSAGPAGPPPPDREVDDTELRLRIHLDSMTPTGLDMQPSQVVLLRGTFAGTVTVLEAKIGGVPVTIPPGLSTAALAGTFAVPATATIGVLGGARGVVLSPSAQGSTAAPDEAVFFASPPIQLVLAAAYAGAGGGAAGQAAYQQRRAMISATLRDQAAAAAAEAAAAAPQSLVVAEPPGITFGAVRTTAVSLKVLATTVLPPGNPALATALTLRRDALGGPLDHAALVVNNGTVLSAVRASLSAGLGIPATFPPWFPGHPCILLISVPAAPPGLPIPALLFVPGAPPAAALFLDFAHAFVNAAGSLQVDLRLRAVMWSSLATVTTTVTVTAPFVAPVAGGVLTFGITTPPAVVPSTNVSISPWLFAQAIFLGVPTVAAILAAVNLFAGPALNATIAAALTPAATLPGTGLTLPLAGPFAALTNNQVTGIEPTAPPRTITLPGLPLPLPVDQAQDVTARFV